DEKIVGIDVSDQPAPAGRPVGDPGLDPVHFVDAGEDDAARAERRAEEKAEPQRRDRPGPGRGAVAREQSRATAPGRRGRGAEVDAGARDHETGGLTEAEPAAGVDQEARTGLGQVARPHLAAARRGLAGEPDLAER